MNKKLQKEILSNLTEADKRGQVYCFTVREVVATEYLIKASDISMAERHFNLSEKVSFLKTRLNTSKVSEKVIKIESKEEFRKNRGL